MKKEITTRQTIKRSKSISESEAGEIRCGNNCFQNQRKYGGCDIFPDDERIWHRSDNEWSPCVACLDAEKEADEQLTQEELDKCRCVLAELGARDEQIDIRDAIITKLISAIKRLMPYKAIWKLKGDVEFAKNALGHAKELMK